MNITMLGNTRSGKTNYIVSLFKLLDMCDVGYGISLSDTDDCVKHFLRDYNQLYPDNLTINGRKKVSEFCPSSERTSFFNFTLTHNRIPFLEINSFDYAGGLTEEISSIKDFVYDNKGDLRVDAQGIKNILSSTDIAFVFLDSTILNENISNPQKCIKDLSLDNIVKSLLWAASQKIRVNGRIDVSLILTKTDKVTNSNILENYATELFRTTINRENIYSINRGDRDYIRLLGTFGVTVVGENKTYINIFGKECIKEDIVLEPQNILSSFFKSILAYIDQYEYSLHGAEKEKRSLLEGAYSYFQHFIVFRKSKAVTLADKIVYFAKDCWQTYCDNKKKKMIEQTIADITHSASDIRTIIKSGL